MADNYRLRLFITLAIGTYMNLLLNTSYANEINYIFNDEFSYPGGVAELLLKKQSTLIPTVHYGTQEPAVLDQGTYWQILIGIDLDTLPGEYIVYFKETGLEVSDYSITFQVMPKTYSAINNIRQPYNSAYNIDYRQFSELNFSNTVQPALPLQFPLAGQWDNFFGYLPNQTELNNRKSFNTNSTQPYNHISLIASQLTTVSAPQNAIISRITYATQANQLATVFLDHGRGLYSIISGLNDLSVETGDGVVAGAVIGKLPASTSPDNPAELIWQCVMNGAYIDPHILMRTPTHQIGTLYN